MMRNLPWTGGRHGCRCCQHAIRRAVDEHGRPDVVWANAGIASFAPLLLTDPAAGARTVEVDLLGAYRTMHAALPEIIAARGYDELAAVPEMDRAFREHLADRGLESASASDRVAGQLAHADRQTLSSESARYER
jgi:NAD(P)-dependent dehydrogenase (short-subunit alcohol dehydrogenase family)